MKRKYRALPLHEASFSYIHNVHKRQNVRFHAARQPNKASYIRCKRIKSISMRRSSLLCNPLYRFSVRAFSVRRDNGPFRLSYDSARSGRSVGILRAALTPHTCRPAREYRVRRPTAFFPSGLIPRRRRFHAALLRRRAKQGTTEQAARYPRPVYSD